MDPPGIASKGGVAIPEGKDEATITLNANGNAELKVWKIVVNGTYVELPPPDPKANANANARRGRGAGRITVCSELTELSVAAPMLALNLPAVSVERGEEVAMTVKVGKQADFPGEATVTLVGLPNKATTEAATITKDTTEVVFRIATDATTPVGEVKNLFCEVVVTRDSEPIVHHLGSGRLRVDAPLVKKEGSPAKPSAPPSAALSRLEKLRLEAQERQKAAEEAEAPAPSGGEG